MPRLPRSPPTWGAIVEPRSPPAWGRHRKRSPRRGQPSRRYRGRRPLVSAAAQTAATALGAYAQDGGTSGTAEGSMSTALVMVLGARTECMLTLVDCELIGAEKSFSEYEHRVDAKPAAE